MYIVVEEKIVEISIEGVLKEHCTPWCGLLIVWESINLLCSLKLKSLEDLHCQVICDMYYFMIVVEVCILCLFKE
jgi:hypothetical protein